jgi:hypothetical protein
MFFVTKDTSTDVPPGEPTNNNNNHVQHFSNYYKGERKEEDYELRPEWKIQLKTKCILDYGSSGTVDTLAGWELVQIPEGTFVDFEKLEPA